MYPENTEIIIGLMGKKDTGKSEVANYLMEKHDFGCAAYADNLKYKLADLLNIPIDDFYPQTEEDRKRRENEVLPKIGRTIRQLMQIYGDGCREMLYKEIWIDLMDRLLKERFYGSLLVISDVRYVNEADYIRNNGGFIIKITNPKKRFEDNHVSEIEQDEVGPPFFIIMNDGSLKDLFAKVDKVLESIVKIRGKINHENKKHETEIKEG